MKTLEQIEQQLTQLITRASAQKAEIQTRIDEASQREEKAEADLKKATSSADADKYAKASQDKRNAQDLKTMLIAKRGELSGPLISEAEYKAIQNDIAEALDQINRKGKRQAAELMEQLQEIQATTGEAIAKGNQLLTQLQVDIYRQKSQLQGSEYLHPTEQLRYKKTGLLEIIGQMASQIEWLRNGEI